MSTGKIANEIKIARQRSNHCKENSSSWSAGGLRPGAWAGGSAPPVLGLKMGRSIRLCRLKLGNLFQSDGEQFGGLIAGAAGALSGTRLS